MAIVLWLTLRHHSEGGSAEQAGGAGGSTTNDGGTSAAVSGKKDGSQGETAGKNGTVPTSQRDDAKDVTTPPAAGHGGENKGSTKGGDDPPEDGRDAKVAGDDGKMLWNSPTSGERVSVANLPAGVQIILFLRPAELMRSAEAEKILAALGPEIEAARRELESITASSMADIDQLTIAWPDAAQRVEPAVFRRSICAAARFKETTFQLGPADGPGRSGGGRRRADPAGAEHLCAGDRRRQSAARRPQRVD